MIQNRVVTRLVYDYSQVEIFLVDSGHLIESMQRTAAMAIKLSNAVQCSQGLRQNSGAKRDL